MTPPSHAPPAPLSAAEVAACKGRGRAYAGVWCLEEAGELHLVGPPAASGGWRIAAVVLAVLGAAGLGSAGLVVGLWGRLLAGLGGAACLVLGWAVFAVCRPSWTLRLTPDACVQGRSGWGFPFGERIRRLPRTQLGELSRGEMPGGRVGLRVRLGGDELDVGSHTAEDARRLEALWERIRAGGRGSEPPSMPQTPLSLPPALRAPPRPLVLGIDIGRRLPHAIRVLEGRVDAPGEARVWVHPLDSSEDWIAAKPEYVRRLECVAAAGLPHLQPALALVSVGAEVAILSRPAAGLSLAEICRRVGALEPGVVLELGARVAETLAAASECVTDDAPLAHGRLEPRMLLVDPSGCLRLLEYGFWPPPFSPSADFPLGGIPRAMAPEELLGEGPPDDRYALGFALMHLLYGHLPRRLERRSEQRKGLVDAEHHRASMGAVVSECPTVLSPSTAALLQSLLARFPDDRPPLASLATRLRARARECRGPSVEEWAGGLDWTGPTTSGDASLMAEQRLELIRALDPEFPGRKASSPPQPL